MRRAYVGIARRASYLQRGAVLQHRSRGAIALDSVANDSSGDIVATRGARHGDRITRKNGVKPPATLAARFRTKRLKKKSLKKRLQMSYDKIIL